MAVTVTETADSRAYQRGNGSNEELRYLVEGTADETAAAAALATEAGTSLNGLTRLSYKVDPLRIDADDDDFCIWLGTVQFGLPQYQRAEVGDEMYEFDTTGGTQHITQSKATTRYPTGTAPNFNSAIGVTENGVEGVDIVVPAYAWSERLILEDEFVDATYKRTLSRLTGKVNNGPFRGFPKGEVLFLGARGSQRGVDGDWEVAFSFAQQRNVTGQRIGTITDIAKEGWDYLWVRYKPGDGGDGQTLVRTPSAVYVEQVYEYADFADLGIGTT